MNTPKPKDPSEPRAKAAADLIRERLKNIYSEEPPAKEELKEVVQQAPAGRSDHQDFMYRLSTSGKSLAEIQTAWHNYYVGLPDAEKHRVWQEFYSQHGSAHITQPHKPHLTDTKVSQVSHPAPATRAKTPKRRQGTRSVDEIKKQITDKVSAKGQLKPKHHLQSLMFGLGIGSIVLVVLLFGFFNERIIAPFITPSRSVSSTPIIIDPSTTAAGGEPKIIIPKINVEIPVDYTQTSIDDAAVDRALETGILHYPTTAKPGELGNSVFFGHSSNNIFNKGKYKFAFVLLNRLEDGDLFYVTKDGKRYTYRVYEKRVVKPTEVGVLGHAGRPATAALITCDPPGTSINRLVVWGEQISPDPADNTESTVAVAQNNTPDVLPSNAPSLWQRLRDWLSG